MPLGAQLQGDNSWGVGEGKGEHGLPTFGQQLFSRDFHTSNIKTKVKKKIIRAYIIVMSYKIQCEKYQLVQHPLA